MTPEDAAGLVTLWRERADANRYARTFAAILDAMPADDPDELVYAVEAILRDLPRQWVELADIINVAGAWLQRVGGPWAPEDARAAEPGADPFPGPLDLFDLLGGPDADR